MLLEERYRDQGNFFRKTINFLEQRDLTDEVKIIWLKEYVLSLNRESYEVLDEVSWKQHQTSNKPIDRQRLLEELIDVQKFLWNMFHLFNFTVEDICKMYDLKSSVVEDKWRTFVRNHDNG